MTSHGLHRQHSTLRNLALPTMQRGFTMIEVMIAMLVMAIGLLGIAGMQTFGMRQTLNSQMLSVANSQVNDMVERMQANNEELSKVKMTPRQGSAYDAITGNESNPNCISAKTCTSAQLAQYDAYIWATTNKQLLFDNGNSTVSSTVTNNNDGTFTIAISWREQALSDEEDTANSGAADHSVTKKYATRFQP